MFDKLLGMFHQEEEKTAETLFYEEENDKIFLSKNDGDSYLFGQNNDKKLKREDIENCPWFKKWFKELPNFDPSKESILIVDDNPGIISFMEDDLEDIDNMETFDLDKYNIITFDTNFAAYQFEATQHGYAGLNIKFAILDLTLGGTLPTESGPVKYTGVDIYQQLTIYNPEAKFLFYTGNSLNEYVATSKKIIDQFKKLTGKDINDYVLFKTSLDLNNRRLFLEDWFTK